jgi:hypothetical protein
MDAFWLVGGTMVVLSSGYAVRSIVRAEGIVKQTYGWMGWEARQDLLALADFLPAKAVIGVTDQMAGAVMLYVRRDTFRPGSSDSRYPV